MTKVGISKTLFLFHFQDLLWDFTANLLSMGAKGERHVEWNIFTRKKSEREKRGIKKQRRTRRQEWYNPIKKRLSSCLAACACSFPPSILNFRAVTRPPHLFLRLDVRDRIPIHKHVVCHQTASLNRRKLMNAIHDSVSLWVSRGAAQWWARFVNWKHLRSMLESFFLLPLVRVVSEIARGEPPFYIAKRGSYKSFNAFHNFAIAQHAI